MHILKINGTEKSFEVLPGSLGELLDDMKINQATVVAEVNGVIVERGTFTDTKLASGQEIELIRFVGGG